MLLGTPGGTVDLRTGDLSDAQPADYITKLAGCTPERGEPTRWLRFLDEALAGDQEAIRFLRLWMGYCLPGDTREHALIFLHGRAGTGKSVFLNTAASILGDYAVTAAMETFTASKFDRHSTELAMLRGARLVTASETEEGRAWAESRIKQITGGDAITARFMRQDNFTYRPQFKLTIVGNHAPRLAPVVCPAGQPLFGWQDKGTLGAGVLHLPADSPVITRVLQLFEQPFVPDWLRLADRLRAHWRSRRDGKIELADLPWGVAGPLALTALARRFNLLDHAEPRDVFYPYHWDDAGWIFDPSQSLDRHVTPRTHALHLFNHMIVARKYEPAAAGSFMDRLQQEGA